MTIMITLLVLLLASPAHAIFVFFRVSELRPREEREQTFRTRELNVQIYCERVNRRFSVPVTPSEFCCSTQPTQCADVLAQEEAFANDPLGMHQLRLQLLQSNPPLPD